MKVLALCCLTVPLSRFFVENPLLEAKERHTTGKLSGYFIPEMLPTKVCWFYRDYQVKNNRYNVLLRNKMNHVSLP